ncbi:5' exonuclease Apollo-like [Penaeus chinensis]|uniref:5' exonuclease Apollo-like n=1 Tax=Penaeus chinensis TaxID=139456 RepID=UPI001FB72772|nr:5' exonuclease Apollo-like [Penaeus chinensis]
MFDFCHGKVAYLSKPTAGNVNIRNSYPDHTIKISVRELGREDLLEAVARRFQERILVNQDKFKVLELLQYSDAFTNDPSQARIHAVPMSQIQVRTHERWNEESPTISIVLTALFVGWPHGPYSSQANKGIFKVMYSDHSSYDELMQMVGCLRPRRIIPIVQKWSKVGWWADPNAPDQSAKFDMSVYDHLLTYPPPDPILIPEAITRMMYQGGPLMISHQPRRCSLRHGLAPRPRRALGVRGVVFTSPERVTESPVPSGSMTLDVSFRTDTSCSIMHPKLYFPNTDQDSNSMATQTPRKILKSRRLSSSDDKDNYVTMSDLRLRIMSRTKALAVSHFISLDSEDATGNGKSSSEVLKKAKAICQSLSYVDALF